MKKKTVSMEVWLWVYHFNRKRARVCSVQFNLDWSKNERARVHTVCIRWKRHVYVWSVSFSHLNRIHTHDTLRMHGLYTTGTYALYKMKTKKKKKNKFNPNRTKMMSIHLLFTYSMCVCVFYMSMYMKYSKFSTFACSYNFFFVWIV